MWLSGKESACQYRRCGFHPWVGKIHWRRKWQLAPVFLPGKFHGQRSLVDYSPWVVKSHMWLSTQSVTQWYSCQQSFLESLMNMVSEVMALNNGRKPESPVELFFFFLPCYTACRIFPDQGWNSCPLYWKCRIVATGLQVQPFYNLFTF